MRVDAPEVAEDFEVQRTRLDAFRPAFTQPLKGSISTARAASFCKSLTLRGAFIDGSTPAFTPSTFLP